MALEEYLTLSVLIDGRFQAKITNIEVTLDGGRIEVETLEGLVGYTQGNKKLNFTGKWVVPKGGPEFDFVEAIALGTFHDITIPYGVKSLFSEGFFKEGGLSQGLNASLEGTTSFIGTLNPPKRG